ncbi:CHRD domain-containing protein [Acaryochloris sp. IP29b_bin.148]|uniref:CHRD domain-containing protein n=1 Tax=Acaryochloris sp. IP29b_bin.148 TaxID=2969218 RepID=UPI00263777A0|nr:CHRD domain-containing protein [Acaryochloris sp. IP29b_bin.148]
MILAKKIWSKLTDAFDMRYGDIADINHGSISLPNVTTEDVFYASIENLYALAVDFLDDLEEGTEAIPGQDEAFGLTSALPEVVQDRAIDEIEVPDLGEGSEDSAVPSGIDIPGDLFQPPVRAAAVLTADQEVTPSNNPDARGTSVLQLNSAGDAVSYQLTIFDLDFGQFIGNGAAFTADTSDDVTKVHIHNAVRGENGPLAFAPIDLSDLSINDQDQDDLQITHNLDGSVTLTGRWETTDPAVIPLNEFVHDFRTAESGADIPLYWNIHTEGSPDGAIRGQFEERELQLPVSLSSELTTDQEVTPSNNPEASGTSTLLLNQAGDAISYQLTVFGLDFGQFIGEGTAFTADTSDDVTKVHVHNAVRGENGPLAFAPIDLSDLSINDQDQDDLQITQNLDGSVTLQGVWETSDPALIPLNTFVNDIREAGTGEDLPLYWNIHTEGSPDGAIRGQWQLDALTGNPLPNILTATATNNLLQGSDGIDHFVLAEHLVQDDLQQQFYITNFGESDQFDLGSADIIASQVLSDNRLEVNLSSGDTLTLIGDIGHAQSLLYGA